MTDPSLFDEHTPTQHPVEDNRVTMSVVLVESAGGPRRCAHAAHIAEADDDELADEWVRTLLAAATLRGEHLRQAVLERMHAAGAE